MTSVASASSSSAPRHAEGGVLTPEEREMVFGAILRVSRSAQRRSAAATAAAAGAATNGRTPWRLERPHP